MQKKKNPGRIQDQPTAGEFAELLREIEKEPAPERLLELALKLQVVLAKQRSEHPGPCEEE